MYVDPSLIDFNLRIKEIDGIECIVNYSKINKGYEHSDLAWTYPQYIEPNFATGFIHDKCIELVHIKNQNQSWCIYQYPDHYIPKCNTTRACWLKSLNNDGIMVNDYGSIWCGFVDIKNRRFRIRLYDENLSYSSWATMSVVPPVNEWFYCAIIYTTDGRCKLYINGQLSATVTLQMPSKILVGGHSFDACIKGTTSENNTVWIDDSVGVRDVLWTENFEPPTEALIPIDESEFDINIKTKNNLICFPTMLRNRNMLKVY